MTPDKIRELISRPGGYRLSEGVAATVGGIAFDFFEQMPLYEYCYGEKDEYTHDDFGSNRVWLWTDAAERLWYRDGEPWSKSNYEGGPIYCGNSANWINGEAPLTLHRLAAILCDDAEAFRVLHWCVTNLGDKNA